MRAAEVGAIALGLVAVLSGACSSKSGSASLGSKQPTASKQAPSTAPTAQQQPKSQPPAVGGGPTEPGAPHTPATAAGTVSSIAAAECDREVRCNKVGPNQTYKSRADCISKKESDKRTSINDQACSGGINQGNVNRCIQALHEEECANPLLSLQRQEACKTDSMCLKKK